MEKNNFTLMFGHLAVYLFVWVFAITCRAAATAWVANYYGDQTAKNNGRITLNPFVQSDLIGTIIIPIIAFIFGWMNPGFGVPFFAWGRPVPVDPQQFRNPKLGSLMTGLAAVFVNILIALISFVLLKLLLVVGVFDLAGLGQVIARGHEITNFSWIAPFEAILWYGLILNLILAVFSMIPFPPFNGGAVLRAILPERFNFIISFFNRFGLIIAVLLIYLGGIDYFLNPILLLVISSLGFNAN